MNPQSRMTFLEPIAQRDTTNNTIEAVATLVLRVANETSDNPVSLEQLWGRKRNARICAVRRMAAFVLCNNYGYTSTQVGAWAGLHRATVVHSCHKVEQEAALYLEVRHHYRSACEALGLMTLDWVMGTGAARLSAPKQARVKAPVGGSYKPQHYSRAERADRRRRVDGVHYDALVSISA